MPLLEFICFFLLWQGIALIRSVAVGNWLRPEEVPNTESAEYLFNSPGQQGPIASGWDVYFCIRHYQVVTSI